MQLIAKCISVPKHLQKVSPTLCLLASLRLLSAFRLFEVKATLGLTNHQASLPIFLMTNHHLSVEQRFHLEAAFREIDACQDLEKLREITKQIITAQENEKAFAREAMSQLRKEMEFAASQQFGFNWGQS